MDKSRLEAFSDGVFAVAITLLVLDLNVPGPGHGTLAHQLGAEWPAYAAFVVSFMVIGIIWVNHHVLFTRIVAADRTLLFLNLLLLLFVTVIPFPTRIFSEYLRTGGFDARVAAALYGAVMWGLSIGFGGVYLWAGRRDGLLHEKIDPARHREAFRQFGMGNVAYAVLVLIAFANAYAALIGHFLVALFYVVDRTASPESAS